MLTKSSKFIEYMKIHLISLDQDLEALDTYDQEEDSKDWHYIVGQVHATKHLLSVATDIMNESERV